MKMMALCKTVVSSVLMHWKKQSCTTPLIWSQVILIKMSFLIPEDHRSFMKAGPSDLWPSQDDDNRKMTNISIAISRTNMAFNEIFTACFSKWCWLHIRHWSSDTSRARTRFNSFVLARSQTMRYVMYMYDLLPLHLDLAKTWVDKSPWYLTCVNATMTGGQSQMAN